MQRITQLSFNQGAINRLDTAGNVFNGFLELQVSVVCNHLTR